MSNLARRAAARRFRLPRIIEEVYVQQLRAVMGLVIHDVEEAIGFERERTDAIYKKRKGTLEVPNVAITLRTMITRRTEAAFDSIAPRVVQHTGRALRGISPHDLGLGPVVDIARKKNVDLMRNAGRAYAESVNDVLTKPENYGLHVKALQSQILAAGAKSQAHAELIARDQTLKLNAAIQRERCSRVGVDEYDWVTAGDSSVRPNHAALGARSDAGEHFRFDSPPPAGNDDEPLNPGEDYQCLPGDVEIQSADGISKAFRRWYCGDLTSIVTEHGKTIRATANHPILSLRGWVPINSLKRGDYVAQIAEKALLTLEHEKHNAPASIRDVFTSCSVLGAIKSAGGSKANFHGDGSESDIDIISVAEGLSVGALASLDKSLHQFRLTPPLTSAAPHPGTSQELFARALLPGLIRFDDRSDIDIKTIPGLTWVRVASVGRENFEGHVYNLQTATGWYVANGIVTHNCRCVAAPVLE